MLLKKFSTNQYNVQKSTEKTKNLTENDYENNSFKVTYEHEHI